MISLNDDKVNTITHEHKEYIRNNPHAFDVSSI